MANQISALTEPLQPTTAQNDVFVNEDEGLVEIAHGFTKGSVSSYLTFLGALLLVPAGAITWVVTDDSPVGTVLLMLGVICAALHGIIRRRTPFQILMGERVVRYGDKSVSFQQVRPEHLAWAEGSTDVTLRFQGHGIDAKVVTVGKEHQTLLWDFRNRLWNLLAATDPAAMGTYGHELSRTQWWILGVSAVFADVSGVPVDSLESRNPMARKLTARNLEQVWGVTSVEELADRVQWLTDVGHRRDFGHAAHVTSFPPQVRQEYVQLLQGFGSAMTPSGAPETPQTQQALARLVQLRWGPNGDRAASVLHQLPRGGRARVLTDDALVNDVSWFAWALLTDPAYWTEELYRLRQLAGQHPAEVESRYLMHDYTWAMILLRLAYGMGWIEAEQCWSALLPMAQRVQGAYGSWDEMGHYFLESRKLWGGPDAPNLKRFAKATQEMRDSAKSPWNAVPWQHPLQRDW